jgi:hypothetical protein
MKTKILNNSVLYIKRNKGKASLFGLAFILTVIIIVVIVRKRKPVSVAEKYLGQEETTENLAFKNADFQTLMKSAGWYSGAEWCAFFARMVWLKSLPSKKKAIAEKLLSGSSQQTFLNFQNDNSGFFKVSQTPKEGSIVIWQSTKTPTKGHVGIVKKVTANGFETIEGNSNIDNSPGKVAHLIHTFAKSPNGLKLRGFINIV